MPGMSLPPPVAPDASPLEAPFDCAALLDALPWGVLVLDAAGVIRRINTAAARWCDAPPEALLNQPLAQAPLPPALASALKLLQAGGEAPPDVWLPHARQWVSLRLGPAPARQRWIFWEDATARHHAQATQQRRSQLLLDMEAVAHTGSYEADLTTGTFYFSDGMYRLFGEAPQAFEPTLEVIDARSHPDDAAQVRQVLDQAISTRQPYTYRRRIRRADGQWRTLEAHGEVICDAAGAPIKLRGLVQDVTERVQAEQALHQNQELLRRTVDSSLDLVQVFQAVRDEQGAIVDFTWVLNNAAAEQVYGDVIGQRLCEHNPGVIEEGIFDTFRQVVETGVPAQDERHYVHEQFDGWFYQSVVKLGDGVATTTRNISQRKKAEAELRQTKELLQAVLDSSRFEVQAFGAVRNAEGRIVDFTWLLTNRTWAESYGGDMTGKSLLQQNPGVVETGLFEKFVHVTETGVPVDHEQYYAHEQFNGWFHQTLVKLGDGFVMNTLDITERKLAEQQLRQSQHLLQTVFDVSLNPIAYHQAVRDAAGRIVDFEFQLENREARQYATHNRTGQRYSEAYPGILDTEVFRLYCAVVETGEPLDAEVQLNLKGVERWFHLQAARLDDGLVATAVDVTERKRAHAENLRLKEELAQKAQERYYSLFATMEEGVSILEMVYDEHDRPVDMRWVEVNPAFERITGLQDVAGKLTSSFLPTEQYWLDAYDSVVKTGQSLRYENYHAGIKQWYRTHTSRIGGPGSRVVANVFEDITEQKEREVQQRAAAQAETFRLQLADALSPLLDPVAIQETVTQLARLHFGADRCYYCEIEGGQAIIRRDAATAGLPSVAGTYPLADFALLQAVIEAGRPFIVHDVRQDPTVDDNLRQLCVALHVISYLDVPVIKNGQPVGVLCLVQSQPRDWTAAETALAAEVAERTWTAVERARAEEALRNSEATLAAVLDALPVGIGLTAPDGRLTLANHQMRRYLPTGIMPSRDATQPLRWHAVGPDGQPLPPTEFPGARAQRGERVVPGLEMLHTPAEGPPVWTQVFAVPLRYHHDQVAGHVTVILDIDARKRAEEALRASEEKFRTLFETIDEGFCVQELVFDQAGRVVDLIYREANAAFEQHTGLAEANGKRASEVFPHIEPYWFDALTRVYQTGVMERTEGYNVDTGRWLTSQYLRIGGAGSPFIAAVFSDITERKQLEQQQAFLLKFSDALRTEPDADAVAHRALALLQEQLGLDRCYLTTYYLDENRADVDYQLGNDTVPPLPAYFVLSDYPEALALTFTKTVVIEDDWERQGLSEAEQHNSQQLGMRALLAATVRKEGQPLWSLAAINSRPRRWTPGEIALVEEVAERTWAALEHARAEEALRESEEKFASLFAASPAPFIILQPDAPRFTIMDVNDSYLRATMRTREGLLGRAMLEAFPDNPADPDIVGVSTLRASLERVLATRKADALLDLQYDIVRPDGTFEKRWWSPVNAPVLNERGEVQAIIHHVDDVTERHRAQQAVQQSEARLRGVLDGMGEGFGLLAPDFTILEHNREALRLDGRARAEIIGHLHWAVYPESENSELGQLLKKAMSKRVPVSLEHLYAWEEGRARWLEMRAYPMDDGSLAVFWRDVTERRRTEAALREAEARHLTELEQQVAARTRELRESRDLLQTVFDTNLIAMSVLEAVRDEAGTIQDFRLRLVSRELERETGRTDLEGKLYIQEYPGIRDVGIFDLIVQTVETGQPQGMEYFYPHEGFDKWFACQFVKLGDGVVATNLDITERKTAEQERLRNLRLLEQAEAVAGLGSWDYDLATGTMRWSDGMYHLFGLPPGSAAEPRRYLDAVLPADRPRAKQLVRRLRAGQGFEETLRLQVGEQVKTVRLKAVVLREVAGQPTRVLGVDVDISELQRLEADNLRLRLMQQQALFEAVQAAQEAERKRIAEGLHNGIGQILYATKLRIDRLHAPLLGTDPALVAARAEADRLLSEAIHQIRALSHELVPMVLEEFGLAAAFKDICSKMSTPRLRLRGHVELDEEAASLPPPLRLALYRMAQELAQNIMKHARGATAATLELETTPGWVLLRAEDNGRGFPVAPTASDGLGLRSIRDRVALLGGQVETGSRPTGGAYVRIRIPLHPSATP